MCLSIKKEPKTLINERNTLHQEASKSGDDILMQEFKSKCKEVKRAVRQDKKLGRMRNLSDQCSSKHAWKTVKNILGTSKNMSPTSIRSQEDGSLVSNPGKLAATFNNFFLEKVRTLRAQTDFPPKLDPVDRLKQWLDQRGKPLPPFSLNEINLKQLRKLINRMKGGKSSGSDDIDS